MKMAREALLAVAAVACRFLSVLSAITTLVTYYYSSGQGFNDEVGYFCLLTGQSGSFALCDGVFAMSILVLSLSVISSVLAAGGITIPSVVLRVVTFSLQLAIFILQVRAEDRGTLFNVSTAFSFIGMFTDLALVIFQCCYWRLDDQSNDWPWVEILLVFLGTLTFLFSLSNILVSSVTKQHWDNSTNATTCFHSSDKAQRTACALTVAAGAAHIVGVIPICGLAVNEAGRALVGTGVSSMVLGMHVAAAVLSTELFESDHNQTIFNYEDGKSRYAEGSVVAFLFINSIAWLGLFCASAVALLTWIYNFPDRAKLGYVIGCVCRVLLMLSSIITLVTYYYSSGQGFNDEGGYFCLLTGQSGSFALCDGVFAMSILVLSLSVISSVLAAGSITIPSVVLDVVTFSLQLAMFIVQVRAADRGTLLNVSTAFSFIGLIANLLVFLQCCYWDRKSHDFPWIISLLVFLGALSFVFSLSNILVSTVTQQYRYAGNSTDPSTCFQSPDKAQRTACALTVAAGATNFVGFPLVLFAICCERGRGVVWTGVSFVLLGLHVAATVLSTADHSQSSFNSEDGKTRYAAGSIVAFLYISTLVWLGFLVAGVCVLCNQVCLSSHGFAKATTQRSCAMSRRKTHHASHSPRRIPAVIKGNKKNDRTNAPFETRATPSKLFSPSVSVSATTQHSRVTRGNTQCGSDTAVGHIPSTHLPSTLPITYEYNTNGWTNAQFVNHHCPYSPSMSVSNETGRVTAHSRTVSRTTFNVMPTAHCHAYQDTSSAFAAHLEKSECRYLERCCDVLRKNISKEYSERFMTSEYFQCYCVPCRTRNVNQGEVVGHHSVLKGWCRFPLVPYSMTNTNGWKVGYHGTQCGQVESILKEGRLLKASDVKKDDFRIPQIHGNEEGDNRIFLSPSLRYSTAYSIGEAWENDSQFVVVVETKVRPPAIVVMPETLAGAVNDPNVSPEQMEWTIREGEEAVLCALLVRRVRRDDVTACRILLQE